MKRIIIMFSLFLLITGVSTSASAKVCALTINGSDQIKYDKNILRINLNSCTKVTLTLNHTGKLAKQIMGHNWVLTETKHYKVLTIAALKAGPDKNYIPDDRSHILAHTKMLGGGENDTVEIDLSKLKKGGKYTYFCSFPGHASLMKGSLVIE